MHRLAVCVLALSLLAACGRPTSSGPYHDDFAHSQGGLGRFYLGREIARPVDAASQSWMERPERAEEERVDRAIAAMELRDTDVVADVGAGSGYYTVQLAAKLARGRVIASEIDAELVASIRAKLAAQHLGNVTTVLATERDPMLPAGVDVALFVDAYHELAWPLETMQAVRRSLARGGRVILVEYRGEDASLPIKPTHKMTEAQARKEMAAVGLAWVKTVELPVQHLMVFRADGPPGR